MTDTTGSLLYNITTEYVKVDMKNNLQLFDTSGYLSGHSCCITDNKKQLHCKAHKSVGPEFNWWIELNGPNFTF